VARPFLTIDLFLNIHPFTPETKNKFGTNVDLHGLNTQAPLRTGPSATAPNYSDSRNSTPDTIRRNIREYYAGTLPRPRPNSLSCESLVAPHP